jgi:hypothetical protein
MTVMDFRTGGPGRSGRRRTATGLVGASWTAVRRLRRR